MKRPTIYPMTTTKPRKPTKRQVEIDEAREHLLRFLKPGSEVYCVLRHVSRSGMRRHIDFYSFSTDENGRVVKQWLSGWFASLLDYRRAPRDQGLKVDGCGMDMGFHVVYNVGRMLWPNGTPAPHGRRNGTDDSDGGYALKAVWL